MSLTQGHWRRGHHKTDDPSHASPDAEHPRASAWRAHRDNAGGGGAAGGHGRDDDGSGIGGDRSTEKRKVKRAE